MVFQTQAPVLNRLSADRLYHIGLPCLFCRYLRRKAECEQLQGDACEIGGFTRVLQSGKQDDLVGEVPTFIAKPYPEEHDYPPLERPYAIQQWLEEADIPEQYVFLADPDHIFLRPIPNLIGSDMRPVGYRFWYMTPAKVGACTMKFTQSQHYAWPTTTNSGCSSSDLTVATQLLNPVCPRDVWPQLTSSL